MHGTWKYLRRHRARHARCFFAFGADNDNVNFGNEWRYKLDRDLESVCMSIQKGKERKGKGREGRVVTYAFGV